MKPQDIEKYEQFLAETQQRLDNIVYCIGQLQQNRSPQPIPPTNEQNPTNKGNDNTQGRERGSIRVEGVEWKVKTFIKADLPFAGGVRAK